ncbi:hypothetical protein CK203_015349 [Vitis vinifera]|uniref:DUF4283 domain-containing protein n=1 Tax=Vitis vinifera TaxID=29760 RepID=A0A438JK08_VITVI|nr:hypothetical protein CK203_015349 [Vitis vinifera]
MCLKGEMEERERPRERVSEGDGEESWFEGANGESEGYLKLGRQVWGRSLKPGFLLKGHEDWPLGETLAENGRFFSLERGENKEGCFLKLGVLDREKKRFNIFVPRGRGAKGDGLSWWRRCVRWSLSQAGK